ncbi:MAG: hypothetical protein RSC84_03225 [Peptostreptococcaceae bacterium]
MRKIKDGKVIYLVAKRKDTMDLRCNDCGDVKNEDDITTKIDKNTGFKRYICECGCGMFTPQLDLEELI